MSTMDNLVHATMIHTNGLMRGSWNRVASEKSFNHIFESWTHPKLKLKFTKAYLLEIENDDDESSYSYFWNPVEGYLTERALSQEDKKLSVELVVTEVDEDESNEILEECRREKNKLQTKIDDLTKQLHTMQIICNTQEKRLENLLNILVSEKEPEVNCLKNDLVNKNRFLQPVSNQDKSERLEEASGLRAYRWPSNPDRDMCTVNSFDNTLQLGYDPHHEPSVGLGQLQYGMHVEPLRGYDPYYQNVAFPVFNQPIHYPYSIYDHYCEGHLGTCTYPSFPMAPPPPMTDPSGMGLPWRFNEHMPMANQSALVHQQPPVHESVSGENANSIAENRTSVRDSLQSQKNSCRVINNSKNSSFEFKMNLEPSFEQKLANKKYTKAGVQPDDRAKNENPGNFAQSDSVAKSNSPNPQIQSRVIRSEKNGIGLIMGPHDPSGDKMLREFRRQSRLQ